MDPSTLISAALIAGLSAGITEVAGSAIQDSYEGLKNRLFTAKKSSSDIEERLSALEEQASGTVDQDRIIQLLIEAGIEKDEIAIALSQTLLKMAAAEQSETIDIRLSAKSQYEGEHLEIYERLQMTQYSKLRSNLIDFSARIAERTEHFEGREYVFDAFDSFVGEENSGYFIVEGEPGIGKTALSAELVKRRGYLHHFNIASQSIRSTGQFLANICTQLISTYSLPYDELPDGALDNGQFLMQCLTEAANKSDDQPVIIVVDSLDESDYQTLPPRANYLYLPQDLPDGVYILLTTRPLSEKELGHRATFSNVYPFTLDADSDDNETDVRNYITKRVSALEKLQVRIAQWGVAEHSFIEKLMAKSEGNFIYLRYVIPEIAAGGFLKGTVDELPKGLRAYYNHHWQQMQIAEPKEFEATYAKIVCILAVTREPVTVTNLHQWTEVDISKVGRAIEKWWEFLSSEVIEGEQRFQIYHTSFQDYLAEVVDLKQFRLMLVKYYRGQINKPS